MKARKWPPLLAIPSRVARVCFFRATETHHYSIPRADWRCHHACELHLKQKTGSGARFDQFSPWSSGIRKILQCYAAYNGCECMGQYASPARGRGWYSVSAIILPLPNSQRKPFRGDLTGSAPYIRRRYQPGWSSFRWRISGLGNPMIHVFVLRYKYFSCRVGTPNVGPRAGRLCASCPSARSQLPDTQRSSGVSAR
jgi:hypothetical protein